MPVYYCGNIVEGINVPDNESVSSEDIAGNSRGGESLPGAPGNSAIGHEAGKASSSQVPLQQASVADFEAMRKTLPEDLAKHPAIASTKSFTSFAEQFINAQKLIGSKISIPKEGDEKGWDELYNKLGRPETPDKYQVKRPELIDGLSYDPAMEKRFLEVAHKKRFTQEQVNAAVEFQVAMEKEKVIQAQKAMSDTSEALKKEWGNTYNEKVSNVVRFVDEMEKRYPGLKDSLETSGMGNNPAFVKLFSELAAGFTETPVAGNPGGNGARAISSEEASREINRLMGDKEFAEKYFNSRVPGHNDAVAQMNELHVLAAQG